MLTYYIKEVKEVVAEDWLNKSIIILVHYKIFDLDNLMDKEQRKSLANYGIRIRSKYVS